MRRVRPIPPWRESPFGGDWIKGLQQGSSVQALFINAGKIFPPFKSTQSSVGTGKF